ncbi:MAG: hypothetical protein HC844_18190 [Tabrizicola sp.]|nr:hypothetical protein [Tabrizicola sp.]
MTSTADATVRLSAEHVEKTQKRPLFHQSAFTAGHKRVVVEHLHCLMPLRPTLKRNAHVGHPAETTS